jgi:hypothetical protein
MHIEWELELWDIHEEEDEHGEVETREEGF